MCNVLYLENVDNLFFAMHLNGRKAAEVIFVVFLFQDVQNGDRFRFHQILVQMSAF